MMSNEIIPVQLYIGICESGKTRPGYRLDGILYALTTSKNNTRKKPKIHLVSAGYTDYQYEFVAKDQTAVPLPGTVMGFLDNPAFNSMKVKAKELYKKWGI